MINGRNKQVTWRVKAVREKVAAFLRVSVLAPELLRTLATKPGTH